jgi:hypothetical protein
MPPAVHEIPAAVLDEEELERKIYAEYSAEKDFRQFVDYRSEGDTRLTINGSRHYRSPFGALPSVTTLLSAVTGNKIALERWNAKNPGVAQKACERGTLVHSYMERWFLGERDFKVDPEVEPYWRHLPPILEKMGRAIWAESPIGDAFPWCVGGDGIARVWHPGVKEGETWGWAGACDLVCEYKGKIVLADLKTSSCEYVSKPPGPGTPKELYGKRRAGLMKYCKTMKQLAAYNLALEHTIGIKPDIHMIFVATESRGQTFAVSGSTIDSWKEKWLKDVEKYYTEILPKQKQEEIDFEVIDGDRENDKD